jgi:hypothetical protein
MTPDTTVQRARLRAGEVLLRLVAAGGLAVDAYVHLDLASGYDANVAVVSEGTLFRVEGVTAVVAALLVLLTRGRLGALLAFLVAAGGAGVLLLYQYVDVGAIGPLPNMYEPIAYPEKTFSLIAEIVAAVAALILLGLALRRPRGRVNRGPA